MLCVWWVFLLGGRFLGLGWWVCVCDGILVVSCVVFSGFLTEGVLDHLYVAELGAPMWFFWR